jgi:phage tail sheath protein FI
VPEYLAPGVYVEETSFRAPSIEGVGTSTAAFVGPTLTGPISGTPELLTSFGDFANIYGGYDNLAIAGNTADPKNLNYLALSVKAFFDNGGSRLYVSRVFTKKGDADTGTAATAAASDDHLVVQSRYPGTGGNGSVTVSLVAARTQAVGNLPPGTVLAQVPDGGGAPTIYTNGTTGAFKSGATPLPTPLPAKLYALTMSVTAHTASGANAVYEGLGFDPAHPRYIGAVLGPVPPRRIDALENQFAFVPGKNLNPSTLITEIFGALADPANTASKVYVLSGGDDGGEPSAQDYDDALVRLQALEDIAIVCAPGAAIFSSADAVAAKLIAHVSRQRAYRVAILDTPPNFIASQVEDVRSKMDSSYAALYTPWIVAANPLARPGTSAPAEVTVPPSGFMAGIYARNDQEHGVAKAPANEVVLGALRFERDINFAEQGVLNPLGINCLRFFSGRGYRVWGARTASSDSEFKYINVRRYLIYLEHSIDRSSQWAVFENNGPALWARVRESVDAFLYNEFREGNLLGTTPAEAYFVRCDRSTMTQNDLDNGRLICLIGVALLKPAEFVIFRIGQKTADARV